nr:hypothetical protein [Tanacetum cinerariifolium]
VEHAELHKIYPKLAIRSLAFLQKEDEHQDTVGFEFEKEEPPQDFDIRKLIREECCIEVCEEQKHNMENTILELVEICRQKSFIEVKNVVEQPAKCRTRIKKSLQNFRVIQKSSISLKNTSQISLVHAVTPIRSTKEPEYSPSMGYEHLNTTPKTESDEIIKSGVEELVPIPNECKDIEYFDASLPDPEFVSLEEENVVYVEEEEVDLEEISQIQDIVL